MGVNQDLTASRSFVHCIFCSLYCLYGRDGSAWIRDKGANFCVLEEILDVTELLFVITFFLLLLAGSEGKLTVVAQKMSVLSGEDPRRKLLLWWKKLSRRLNGRDLYLSL